HRRPVLGFFGPSRNAGDQTFGTFIHKGNSSTAKRRSARAARPDAELVRTAKSADKLGGRRATVLSLPPLYRRICSPVVCRWLFQNQSARGDRSMNLFWRVAIAVFLTAPPTLAQQTQPSPPKTRLEAFTGETGAVVIKGYAEIGSVKGRGELAVVAMMF